MPRRLAGAFAFLLAVGFFAAAKADAPLARIATPATAADTRTITFDDHAPGPVTTQYHDQGVDFGHTPSGDTGGNAYITATPSSAHSPPNSLWIACGVEICPAHTFMDFTAPHSQVTVYAGTDNTSSSQNVAITAYDLSGNIVTSDTYEVGATESTRLRVASTAHDIWFVSVESNWKFIYLDDLTFDVPATPGPLPPDFGLVAGYGSVIPLTAGTSTPVPVTLRRVNGSTGPISLAVAGLPAGVTAGIDPNPATGGDRSIITLRLTVAADAPPAKATIMVTGTPGAASAGSQPRTLRIPLSVGGVASGFDLRLRGIEVTQGIQRPGILIPNAFGGPVGRYQGVSLAEGGRTIVRVYADALSAPPGGVPNSTVTLDGTHSDGSRLPGGPISPIASPPSLAPTASLRVEQSERADPYGAFTFILPPAWTHGTVSLVARIDEPPAPVFRGDPTYLECTTPICRSNNQYRLEDIEFETTRTLTIDVIEMRNPQPGPPSCPETGPPKIDPAGPPLGSLEQAFSAFVAVVPTGEGKIILRGPRATIYDHACNLNQQVEDWYQQSLGSPGAGDWAIGLQAAPGGGKGGGSGKTAIASATRPLTAMAHELFHLFGTNHASAGCGGDTGGTVDSWPPDQLGYLHGIGLDRRFDNGTPFRMIAAGVPNAGDQAYDFMSYCAGDGNSWVSPFNWEIAFSYLHRPRSAGSFEATSKQPELLVDARIANGTEITGVLRVTGARPLGGVPSLYQLVARDGRGNILAHAQMTGRLNHSHPGGVETQLMGEAPARGVDRLEVVRNGTVVASRLRSAHAPRVRLLAPTGGPGKRVPGRGRLVVRWHASDPDHDRLDARVEYSPNGRNWTEIALNHNTGSTRVQASLLSHSRRAQIRVVVTDGFNETAATSRRFVAAGRAPQAQITAPLRNAKVQAEGTLYLSGTAFDDRFARLGRGHLSWYAGRRLLGHGATLARTGSLRPGRHLIRFVATDAFGRSGAAKVLVRVLPSVPRFLSLRAPRRIGKTARRLTLRVQTTYPTTLRTLGRRFSADRRVRTLRLRVTPGARPLVLRLVLGFGRTATVRAVRIARG